VTAIDEPTDTTQRGSDRTFDAVFRGIADVQGWMTRAQATRLWDRASETRAGERIVEIGSYHGRSAIVLASGAPEGVEVITIDPHGGNDRGPQQFEGEFEQGQRPRDLRRQPQPGRVLHRIRHIRKASQDATADVRPGRGRVHRRAHRYNPARPTSCAGVRRWRPAAPAHPRLLQLGRRHAGHRHDLAVGDRFRYMVARAP
jgi:hypothetical protein